MADGPSFGRLIKLRRRALDLTQEDLARRVGYSVITIRKVESNERRPSRQLAERLARSLDLAGDEWDAFIGLARGTAGTRLPTLAAPSPLELSRPARPAGNVVAPLTRLVGRDDAVAAVRGLLAGPDVRLLTLVGPPGIGKSRLALQVAAELAPELDDGVFVVALAALRDPGLIASAIAAALGAKDLDATSLVDSLVAHLRDRRLLLLVDNVEHLVSGAPVLARILAACPGVRALATSRAPLHLRGEHLYRVPPLALPGPGVTVTAATALGFPAVELFVDRARAANPAFVLTDAEAGPVAEICARVDGVPLSIELVAARSRLLAPAMLLARLGRRLPLLTDGPQDLPTRQQTLRAALDWSYELLEPAQQRLFALLAAFPGGSTLDAADTVIGALDPAGPSVLDGLAALVDQNLLRSEPRGAQTYFVMLETIREYAYERLWATGDGDRVRAGVADYLLGLAEAAGPQLTGAHQEEWFERLDAEENNLRDAIEWYAGRGQSGPALRFVAALWRYWHIRFRADALAVVRRILALPADGDPAVRAHALCGAGWIAVDQNDSVGARAFFDESLALFRALADRRGVAEALHGVATMAQAQERYDEAAALLGESLDLHRGTGDDEGIAWTLDHLALQALETGDHDRARRLFEEALELFARQRHAWGTATLLYHLGLVALVSGDLAASDHRFRQAMAAFRELANGWGVASCAAHRGLVALARGEPAVAAQRLGHALALGRADSDVGGMAGALSGLAGVALARSDPARAAYLLGAIDAVVDSGRARMNLYERGLYARTAAAVGAAARNRPEGAVVARARLAGRAAALGSVVGGCLTDLDSAGSLVVGQNADRG